MAQAIKVIRNEHLGLSALLRTLSGVVQEISKGRQKPDFPLFHEMIDYLKSFMYTFHHPKENDYLFPALARRNTEASDLIEALEQQHREGGQLLKQLDAALGKYENEGEPAFQNFVQAFEAYHQFEWQHMKKEEQEIIPLAQEYLDDEDWAAIDSVFLDHADPLFGDEKRDQFRKLFDHIAEKAPGPLGFSD